MKLVHLTTKAPRHKDDRSGTLPPTAPRGTAPYSIPSCLRVLVVFLLASLTACDDPPVQPPGPGGAAAKAKAKVAYVTNGIDPFWDVAADGAKAAAKEIGAELTVIQPRDLPDQQSKVEELLARGIHGVAISPIDGLNQVGFLNDVAARTKLITHDSDAPESKRLCFIGMNNYLAGREAGRLVKGALPDGGEVMIFVGRLEQLNAKWRRQGVLDELMGRPPQKLEAMTFDPLEGALKGPQFTILGTRTDNFEYAKAKSNAEEALAANQNLKCMLGLFAYNAPNCLEALKGAGKAGAIKLVSFDDQAATLQGIADGHIVGTICQQQWLYGYESVKMLAALHAGGKPPGAIKEVPYVVVTKDTLAKFKADQKKLKGE